MGQNGAVEKKFLESDGVFSVRAAPLRYLRFPLAGRQPATALNNQNSVVLSKETAEKYFGDWKNAIGRTIKVDRFLLTVTGHPWQRCLPTPISS